MRSQPSSKSTRASFLLTAVLLLSSAFVSITSACVSRPAETPAISRELSAQGTKSAKQLYDFFMANNPQANKKKVRRLSKLYIKEARTEGINSDCAWVQMCLETGFLNFGGLVTPDMNNFCGLGAIDQDHPGERFKTEKLGVRAHIQHLHAYATTADHVLKNPLVDKRYKWVNPRGKAPTILELSGTWAADREYGNKLDALLERLEQTSY